MHYHFLLPITFLLLLSATAASHRRLLHQPLFPLAQSQPPTTSSISNPPYPSPAPLPQPHTSPKYPFSTLPPPDTTPQNPFFPFFPSPPPPPPPPAPSSSTAFPTFPANISSLVIPASSHTSHAPTKLISLIISISLFSTLVFVSILILLRRHHHHHHHHHPLKSDSLRLFPPNTAPSDTSTVIAAAAVDPSKKPPPPLFPRHTSTSTSSSEFLYLGTLVSSRDAEYSGPVAAAAQLDAKSSPIPPAAASLSYQRLGSPELQPLPPLPRQQSNQNYNNTTTTHVTSSEGEENDREDDDEFFSPRESTGNNASPYRTRLSPKPKQLNSLTANSPTYSISPDNSPSVVLNSGSPQSLMSKSPDSSVTFPAPITRFIPPPPAREPRAFSPFSPSSTDDCGTRDCSPRPSDFSSAGAVPVAPPPPPARFWEGVPTSGPPELVAPSRKGSKSEEMVKPKLKALHWDKVRASSDRAMVWDQLKSSSFQ